MMFSSAAAQKISAMRNAGWSSRRIAEGLAAAGIRTSPSSIKRYLRSAPKRADIARRVAATKITEADGEIALAETRDADPVRAALLDAEDAAESDIAAAAAALVLLRHDYPDLASFLDRGSSIVDALLSVGYVTELTVLRSPAAIAELARFVTGDPRNWEREDGESQGKFDAHCRRIEQAAHARAVELLEQALAIVGSQPQGKKR